MKAKSTIRIKISSEEHLLSLLEALRPETKRPGKRSKVNIDRDGSFIILNVEAKDTVALRATLNTYLRWIGSTIDSLEVLTNR
ncbi:MAG: KEOPS complex subunit Pcc1 [Candidatus Bathyarchaeota archaeon]|nr:KEOPS complex subunit Pcc1 [Candidatus Bathyarchaeota archaeon]